MPRLVSVAIMLGLSAWLLWLRGSNHAHRAFALFLTSFGLAVFCNTMGAFAAEANKQSWFTLTKHFEIVEIPALIYFVSEYPRPRGWFGGNRLMRGVLALTVLTLELMVLADQSLWFSSVNDRSGLSVGVAGPINAFASKDNLAMALVAILLAFDYAKMEAGRRRSSLLLVWLGFALNALYDSTTSSFWIVRGWIDQVPLPDYFWNRVIYAFNLAALACAVLALALMGRNVTMAKTAASRGEQRLLAALLPLPVLAAVLETILAPNVELFDSPFKLATNGLIRISLALLPTYAFVRYRVFDIELTLKFTLRHSTAFAMLAAIFFLVSNLLEAALPLSGTWANTGAALAIAFALKPIEVLAKRIVNRLMPNVQRSPDYLERRRLDVYRAAFDGAIEDGVITDKERRMLDTVARELGLKETEIQIIERTGTPLRPGQI
jgi:hypothetical protein